MPPHAIFPRSSLIFCTRCALGTSSTRSFQTSPPILVKRPQKPWKVKLPDIDRFGRPVEAPYRPKRRHGAPQVRPAAHDATDQINRASFSGADARPGDKARATRYMQGFSARGENSSRYTGEYGRARREGNEGWNDNMHRSISRYDEGEGQMGSSRGKSRSSSFELARPDERPDQPSNWRDGDTDNGAYRGERRGGSTSDAGGASMRRRDSHQTGTKFGMSRQERESGRQANDSQWERDRGGPSSRRSFGALASSDSSPPSDLPTPSSSPISSSPSSLYTDPSKPASLPTSTGWNPTKKLTYPAMAGLRHLHHSDPATFTRAVLAEKFGISYEAVSRILRSRFDAAGVKADKAGGAGIGRVGAGIGAGEGKEGRFGEGAGEATGPRDWDGLTIKQQVQAYSPIPAIDRGLARRKEFAEAEGRRAASADSDVD